MIQKKPTTNTRISKTANGEATYYIYSSSGLLAELNQNGRMRVAYDWKPDSDWGTSPLWQANLSEGQNLKNASYHYLISDHLGTLQLAINSTGEQSWKINSDAFGNSELDANNQITMNLRFAEQYYDAETGLSYNYFRDYDAKTGRYIQSDPIGLDGGINIYEYAYSNPIGWIDFYGLAGRGGRQNSKGERNRTKNSHGTGNPYKHWRLDKKIQEKFLSLINGEEREIV
jgi:RHS repeat-associated protein